ncbi:MerR family transcriptional regulator [Flavobacterium sp.]|uniref:MerR family transcriptional regulator n=1 Tax=Flavobacterium sp. TaxID=239 RepID=UPI0039E721F9
MNNIKTVFSIKDLENLSGIKAHTIRIWEKRYNVLQPMRTQTNIREYDVANLQKLLNITLLHNHGYKISKISKLPPERIPQLVKEIVSQKNSKVHAVNAFKMAMINFDQTHFLNTYNALLNNHSFRDIFYEVFIPLMNEMGLLWQTDTITPAQEHFISHLVKQKIMVNTEKIQLVEPLYTDTVYVLFLPINEIHELGLMYINYELLSRGHKTIYLGESVPAENLKDLQRHFEHLVFITYTTVQPDYDYINEYLDAVDRLVLENDSELWILGKQTQYIDTAKLSKRIRVFRSIPEVFSNELS